MSAIFINQFFGEATGVTPRLIPQGFAQRSINADTRKKTLKPLRSPLVSTEDAQKLSAQSIFRYPNGKWFAWDADVDVARSPLTDDSWERIYWTGDGAPKMAGIDHATTGTGPYPEASYHLGVPAPDNLLTIVGPEGDDPDTAVTAFYSHAYITAYDEVGPLSLPTEAVTRWDNGGDVEITIPAVTATDRNITKVRIFRSESGGEFNFVADVVAGTASFTDNVKTEDLLYSAESITWDVPPENMLGLISGPGGALYGFFDNVVCASEPGYPHAWPVEYRYAFQHDVVAIKECAIGVVVGTTGEPYLLIGSTPSSMSPTKIETSEPCVSKRSMVDMGDYVIYASPNGLVGIGSDGSNLMTKNLLIREEWQHINPSSISAYRDRDKYLAFYTDKDSNSGCFMFSVTSGFEYIDESISAAFYSSEHDALYVHTGQALLKKWDEGDGKEITWRSGIFEAQPGTSFSCAKVIADSYPLTLNVIADGVQRASIQVESIQMFRLPKVTSIVREWEVEIVSEHEVFSFQVASSPQELV
jgi:hypothetical protein